MAEDLSALAVYLEDTEKAANAWLADFERSQLRLPKVLNKADLTMLVLPVVQDLREAIKPGRSENSSALASFEPGAPELREVEKSVAFIGGRLVAAGFAGFDVAALLLSLRKILSTAVSESQQNTVTKYVEWLSIVALDSFSSARASAERERVREELLEGMPIVHVVRDLPAAFFVGSPDRIVLDSVFSRVLLSVVRVGAKAVILDFSGVKNQSNQILTEAVYRFLRHKKIQGSVEALLVGLDSAVKVAWCEELGAQGNELSVFEHFDLAVERGLGLTGYRVVAS